MTQPTESLPHRAEALHRPLMTPSVPQLVIELTAAETICFAMECASVPLLRDVAISNRGVDAVTGAELGVTLLPGLGAEQRFPLPTLRAGDTVTLPVVDLRLDPGWLRAVTEREPSQLVVRVLWAGDVLAVAERKVQLLAFNEWPGLRAPAGLLAAFVTPNEPCLSPLLRAVGAALLEKTRETAILGYQSGSRGRARAEVAALYDCVSKSGIGYVGVPPSFEDSGQKIRLVETVLSEKLGNCLDLSVLFASALEAMGFAPLLVLLDTHAFCGVWLDDDRFPEGVVEDSARLRTLSQLGALLVFDATAALSGHTLEEAQALGAKHLDSETRFAAALDVRVLRRARYLPLPLRQDRLRTAIPHQPPTGPDQGTADGAAGGPAPGVPVGRPLTATEARFRRWKESLLDLSLRNRLLNFRLHGKSALRLHVPDAALFEDLLAADRALQVLPRPAQSPVRDENLLRQRDLEAMEVAKALQADLANAIIYSAEPDSELWERAIALDRAARRDLEEGGASTLFAAVGLLRWYESTSNDDARLAPLLLWPVKLEFDRRSRRLKLRRQPEDPIPNQTLIEKMRLEFQVDLSSLAVLDMDDSGIDVPKFFRGAREAIQQMPRWEVLSEVHLGLFTFSKFLMWKDLNDNAESLLRNRVVRRIAEKKADTAGAAMGDVPLSALDASVSPADVPNVLDLDGTQLAAVATALNGGDLVLQGPPRTGKSQTITSLIAAAVAREKTVLFVSEKMAALEVVHKRLRDVGLSDFCLELHSHKTNKKDVMASFKAALERPGIAKADCWDEICGEVSAVRNELNTYVGALHASTPLDMSYYAVTARLQELGGRPDIALPLEQVSLCSGSHYRALQAAVSRYAETAARVGRIDDHPWRVSGRMRLDAADEGPLAALLQQAVSVLEDLQRASQQLSQRLGLAQSGSFDQMRSLLQCGVGLSSAIREVDRVWSSGPIAHVVHHPDAWSTVTAQAQAYATQRRNVEMVTTGLEERWREDFFQRDIAEFSVLFERWGKSLWGWFFLRRPKRALLPAARDTLPNTAQIALDLSWAAQLPQLRSELARREESVAVGLRDVWHLVKHSPDEMFETLKRSERFRDAWAALTRTPGFAQLGVSDAAGWRSALSALDAGTQQLRSALEGWQRLEPQLRSEFVLAQDFWPTGPAPAAANHILSWLKYWQAHLHRLREWCQFVAAESALGTLGISAVAVACRSGVPPESLREAFEASFLSHWRLAYVDANPVLREFVGASHHQRVAHFATLDTDYQAVSRQRVLEVLERGLPKKASALKGSELDVLLRECQKKARHLPIRKLLASIPLLRTKLKPCLLMSPLSVAQYLPPDATFDLIVFDEASQIETHDAIGAIARGRQVVIVGDSKQLPPTRFFSRRSVDEAPTDENDVEDLDSILDEAVAKGIPERRLGWHYRSRHDSLIAFSNERYYDSRLQVFPAARRYVEDLGISWHRTPAGSYRAGDGPEGRTNPSEARALVSYLVKALQTHTPSQRTFGVVTFSLRQMELIEDLLEKERAKSPSLERHFEGSEKVFVKNLENVQGDERDEILFSICYGRDASSRMRHHFGPLSLSGGERRLNVAITRARKQLRVFSSITHEDIDLRRTRARGAEDLRRFLQFASSLEGAKTSQDTKPKLFSSVIEKEIHDALVAAGYVVHTKVGVGEFQLDLAVVHPEDPRVYVLAVEADGPTYRDAVVARDRDRLRGDVLRQMLWRTHRVWSPDWVRNKAAEVERLLAAASNAVLVPITTEAPTDVTVVPPPDDSGTNLPGEGGDSSEGDEDFQYPGQLQYRLASLPTFPGDGEELYRPQSSPRLRNVLQVLVRAEAPLHSALAFRRVIGCWGWSKLGARAQKHLEAIVQELAVQRQLYVEDGFLWPSREQAVAYRGFRIGGPEGLARDAEHVAPQEFANALAAVLSQTLSAPEDELLRHTARAVGIERLGARVVTALERGVNCLLGRGQCMRDGERLRWVELESEPPPGQPPVPPHTPFDPTDTSVQPPAAVIAIQQLLSHPIIRSRLPSPGITEAALTSALSLLLKRGGRASLSEFSAALGVPEFRVAGMVASLAQVLNVDGYQVLRLSQQGGAVELDYEILRQTFATTALA
jgi:hypothetical protein